MNSTAAKQVSQALVALVTNDALTTQDLESAFSNAQSAIQAGCSYDDEILANVILGKVQAVRHSRHENGHTLHGSELDSSLRYFQQAVALDAARKSGEYVFLNVLSRTFLADYQSGLALKARRISESTGDAEAASFLTKHIFF